MKDEKKVLDTIIKNVPELMVREGMLSPTLFAFGNKTTSIVSLDGIPNEGLMGSALNLIGRSVPEIPEFIAMVSEVWTSSTEPSSGTGVKDMPDASNAVLCAIQNRKGQNWGAVIPFTRVAGKVVLGETQIHEDTDDEIMRAPLLKAFWKGVINK